MQMQKYYKIVISDGETFQSVWPVFFSTDAFPVNYYRKDIWHRADENTIGFFTFAGYDAAASYMRWCSEFARIINRNLYENKCLEMWEVEVEDFNEKAEDFGMRFPKGTQLFRQIKFVNKMC